MCEIEVCRQKGFYTKKEYNSFSFFLFPTHVEMPELKGDSPLSDWGVAMGALGVVLGAWMEVSGSDMLNLYLNQLEGDVVEEAIVR
jgi:hypothetical protein